MGKMAWRERRRITWTLASHSSPMASETFRRCPSVSGSASHTWSSSVRICSRTEREEAHLGPRSAMPASISTAVARARQPEGHQAYSLLELEAVARPRVRSLLIRRLPPGPQVTLLCHQMGRHPTIWDLKTGIRHRIPARISPWGSRGPNPNFFSPLLNPKMPKSQFSGRVLNLSATHTKW